MIGTPLTFKGLLNKTLVSDETFKRFLVKIQDLRKVSSFNLQYLLLVHKGIQFLNGYLIKQSEILQTYINNDMNDDKRYHNQLGVIFQSIGTNFQHFDTTFESNLKEYHVQTSMEIDELTTVYMDDLMNLYKKYKGLDQSLYDSSKKWLKSQKQLSESIKVYKQAFDDPKLIYNKQQINKRYSNCETLYHNTVKQQVNLIDKTNKLYETKNSYVQFYNRFLTQYSQSCEFVNQKILIQCKRVIELFCDTHRLIVSDLATKRIVLEDTKIKCFLYIVPDMSHEKQCFNITSNFISQGKFPIFLQNPESIKDAHLKVFSKWLLEYGQFLKDCSDNNKRMMKKIHSFIYDLMKTIEKVCSFMIKDVGACFQKIKKKITEVFGSRTLDYIQCINKTLEVSMRVYEKLVKHSWQKLEIISSLMTQDNKMIEMFFKEYYKQSELFNNETKLMDTLHHKKQIRQCIGQKSEIIKYCLNSFGEKLNKNNQIIKNETNAIINQLFSTLNEVFVCSSQYQLLYFDSEFNDKLQKIKGDSKLFCVSVGERIHDSFMNEQIVVLESERFKYSEFVKIKKNDENGQLKARQSISEVKEDNVNRKESVNEEIKRQVSTEEKNFVVGLDSKQKKNFEFIKNKVQFEEGEVFIQTFSCALHDKILLQGKLYLTSERLCFHSYFNTVTLFFGGTFLQIPRKDIIKAEKRLNVKIFDNSIAITTVNGEVFFTSFFARDQAFKKIMNTFGLQQEEEEIKQGQQEKQDNDREQSSLLENRQNKEQPQNLAEPDDMSPEQQSQRLQKLQDVTKNDKLEKLTCFLVKNVNCIYLLNKFFNSQGFTCPDGVKVSSFFFFLKQQFGEKQIVVEKWQPPIETNLNKINIKTNTPLKFMRKAGFNHTLPKSSIPFMPKFCRTEQQDRLTIVSADRFFIDYRVVSNGVPYADTFICYTRQQYINTPKGVEVTGYLFMDFIKKSMFQSVIHKQALKDLSQSQQTYVKLLNKLVSKDPSLKKPTKTLKSTSSSNINTDLNSTAVEQTEQQKQDEEQNDKIEDKKYSELLSQHQKLKRNYNIVRFIVLALVILNVIQLIL